MVWESLSGLLWPPRTSASGHIKAAQLILEYYTSILKLTGSKLMSRNNSWMNRRAGNRKLYVDICKITSE